MINPQKKQIKTVIRIDQNNYLSHLLIIWAMKSFRKALSTPSTL